MILFFYTLFFCTCLFIFRIILNRMTSSFAYHYRSSKIQLKRFFGLWLKIQIITFFITANPSIWKMVTKLEWSENVIRFNILFPPLVIYFIYVWSLFDFSKADYHSKDFDDFNRDYYSDKKKNVRQDKLKKILEDK
jgi:hypothetical protein